MVVPSKSFQPSLLFVGKVRSLSYSGASERIFNRAGSCCTNKHYTRLERLARSKRSCVLRKFEIYSRNLFITFALESYCLSSKIEFEVDWRYPKVSRLQSRKSYWRGRLSTVDLLVLTRLDQLLFYWKYYIPLLQNKLPKWGGQLYWAFPFS